MLEQITDRFEAERVGGLLCLGAVDSKPLA
jgi:hypothetical protein